MKTTATFIPIFSQVALLGTLLVSAYVSVPTAQGSAQTRPSTQATLPLKSGAWTVDAAHTSVNFSVRHMVVSQVRGRFNSFSGVINVDAKDFTKSSVQFTIQVASVDTNQPQRDAHLKTADFFDVAKYPTITFKSTSISKTDGNRYTAHGVFTMHGTSKTIALPFTVQGPVKDSFGTVRAGLQSNLKINRQDYGVKWNQTLDNGGLAVGNDIDIELNLEATPPA
jgi:polyisoprenoid-binding protein YceI